MATRELGRLQRCACVGGASWQELREVFNTIDRNQDGNFTRAELIHALRGDTRVRALLNLPQMIRDTGTQAALG